jgi:curved DNA-binding protein CbpA
LAFIFREMGIRNYHVVQVSEEGQTYTRLKKAYQTMVKKCNPDVNQGDESKERLLEIRGADDTLREFD